MFLGRQDIASRPKNADFDEEWINDFKNALLQTKPQQNGIKYFFKLVVIQIHTGFQKFIDMDAVKISFLIHMKGQFAYFRITHMSDFGNFVAPVVQVCYA